MLSFKSFLIEANPDIMYDKEFAGKINKDKFDLLKPLDPTERTGQFKYLRWLAKIYLAMEPQERRRFQDEDDQKVHDALELYDKFKKDIEKPMNDIGQVKSLGTLYQLVAPFEGQMTGGEEERAAKEDANKVFENEEWVIIVPETQEAACYYGKGTKWCTAAEKNNMFDHYSKDGDLYILINKETKEKFQFHFESAQFMDAQDSQIELKDFLDENPEVADFFEDKIEAISTGVFGAFRDMGIHEDEIERNSTRIKATYEGADVLQYLFNSKNVDIYRYQNWFSSDIADTIEDENGDNSDEFTDYVYRLDDYFDEDTVATLYNLYRRRGGDKEDMDEFDAEDVQEVLADEVKPFCVWCAVQRDVSYIQAWKEAFVDRFNSYFDCLQLDMRGEDGDLRLNFNLDVLEDSYLAESLRNNDLEYYVSELFDKDAWQKVDEESMDGGGDYMENAQWKMELVLQEYSDELSQPDNEDL